MEWRKRESGNAAGISGKQIQTDRVSVRRFSFGAESVLTDTFPAETKRRKLPANLWKYCFRRIVPAADLRPRQGFFHCFSRNTCAALRQKKGCRSCSVVFRCVAAGRAGSTFPRLYCEGARTISGRFFAFRRGTVGRDGCKERKRARIGWREHRAAFVKKGAFFRNGRDHRFEKHSKRGKFFIKSSFFYPDFRDFFILFLSKFYTSFLLFFRAPLCWDNVGNDLIFRG